MKLAKILVGVTLAFGGCTKDQPPAAALPTPVDPPAPPAAAPPSSGDDLSGTVVETMNSGGYTYARLDRGVWLAGPETPLAVGAKLGKTSGSLMTAFRSETLNRTFDQIYFVNSFGTSAAAASPHTVAPAEPVEKIEPIAGGKTVAEIFANKATLATKPVVLRGKIVKVNNGILGRNWLHVQDGTGASGTNDLLVTTAATATKGDVVVVRGSVAINKDFGAGYSYAVLIEDATIASK